MSHQPVNSFLAGEPPAQLQCFLVFRAPLRVLHELQGLKKYILAEIRHFALLVSFIEGNKIFEGPDFSIRCPLDKIIPNALGELIEEYLVGRPPHSLRQSQIRFVNQLRSQATQFAKRLFHQSIDIAVEAEKLTQYPDPRALQSIRIEELRIIAAQVTAGGLGRRIAWVNSDQGR